MIIENEDIKIEINRQGANVTYHVARQTKQFTNILQFLKVVDDPETGFSLRTNRFPYYNKGSKRFYLRGQDASKDNKVVEIAFQGEKTAAKAVEALQRLIAKVEYPEFTSSEDFYNNDNYQKGSTTHVRFKFVNRQMAEFLRLTGRNLYPQEVIDWAKTEPIHTLSQHFNERIGQAINTLNKSIGAETDSNIINSNKVTPEQARSAITKIQRLFNDGFRDGDLRAIWRIIGGIRSCDLDHPILESKPAPAKQR